MRWTDLVPNFLKPALRTPYLAFKEFLGRTRLFYRTRSRSELHEYWKQPWDGMNLPQSYRIGQAQSELLVKLVQKYARPDMKFLEIGCNVGRNLDFLFKANFKELSGIEISEKAVQLMKEYYPEMSQHATIHNAPVEEVIKQFKDGEFDIVFTVAVLEHIHSDSKWIFPEMVRIAKKYLITIEDEHNYSWRHFPRNYRKIFESLNMKQVEEADCSGIEDLGSTYRARVFTKA